MSIQETQKADLGLKRTEMSKQREHAHLREVFGSNIARLISGAVRQDLALDDFIIEGADNLAFDWPNDIRNAPGLTAAYIQKMDAAKIVKCMMSKLGLIDCMLGFHDKEYLGFARVTGFDLSLVVDAAESLEESLLIKISKPEGIVLVDYYPSPSGQPFSVVVQGAELIPSVKSCFE